MSRRKSLVKLPFFKAKINRKTVLNIFGFLILGTSVLMTLSLIKKDYSSSGRILSIINQFLWQKFDNLSFFVPIISLLLGGLFLNSKKIRFIKPNILIGLILIFISLLGLFHSGEVGRFIFSNLSSDFSTLGAFIILLVIFFTGLILFFDTSIDIFLYYVINLFKLIFNFARNYIFRETINKEKEKKEEKEERKLEFIGLEKQSEKQVKKNDSIANVSPLFQNQNKKNIDIKPLPNLTSEETWIYPPLSLLNDFVQRKADRGDVKKNAQIIEDTLDSFGIHAKVVNYNPGPTVTQYEIAIPKGTKLSKITALSNDLALALAASTGQVRIEAPIPGKSVVGIEIPNIRPEIVTLKNLLSSSIFTENNDPLLVPLGLDVAGKPIAASISVMPHVLIAGATGSGKSVLLNSWITSFLIRTKPKQLRLVLVDPKRVELTLYNGIPHLLTEVIVETEKIISALKWTVAEMEERYKIFSKMGVRNLEGYNKIENIEKKPYIIFIIDELADLMMFAPGEAEELITRIAQMARATGIHLVLSTQRPSVEVITGLMKANIPTRVAFNVSSMIDSRVIIDMPGAEKLLGKGDMLYLPPDKAKPIRIQGPFLTEKDVNNIVGFLKSQSPEVHYTQEVVTQPVTISNKLGTVMINGGDKDPLFDKAVEIIIQHDKASASLLQRRLSIGYTRAARILDQLEVAGYVGPAEGAKPREVIKRQKVE